MDVLSQARQSTTLPPNWLAGLCLFIKLNATDDLTLADLANAANVTPRALQYAFKQYYQSTPMRYVRQQRLVQVNTALKAKTSNMNVTQAAIASGFTNLGVFARYYRQEFGELPSRTRGAVLVTIRHVCCGTARSGESLPTVIKDQ